VSRKAGDNRAERCEDSTRFIEAKESVILDKSPFKSSMSDPNTPESTPEVQSADSTESFAELFSEYEKQHSRKTDQPSQGREGTVVTVTDDSVLVDIGFKSEGILPRNEFPATKVPQLGDKLLVNVKGRDAEGYYQLSIGKVVRPTDWDALEKAFNEKATIIGTVTGVVKGGLSVDVGVRAFMPASRTGTRDAAEMAKLVEQEIRCRITKLDVTEEDVVVDRRVILEEEDAVAKGRRFSELKEGDTVQGTIRSIADYGAFVDIGGVDALLHVGEISWHRVNKPSDVLSEGQQIEARILKIDADKRRVSLSMKQLQPHPWDAVPGKYKVGERVRGVVTRIMDFGAFVEIEPGIEGLIHISEMSWTKRVRNPGDVLKPGETVEAVILTISPVERRIGLGLKQALGDPWADVGQKYPAGSVIEGPVTNIAKFGAFVQLIEGVEGLVHISEITTEKRLNSPHEMLKVGQVVKALVLAVDTEKRLIRLSMKQLLPSGLDEFIAEHAEGDVVTGRVIEVSGAQASIELGESTRATCRIAAPAAKKQAAGQTPSAGKPDLSSLTSMLQARWKSGAPAEETEAQDVRAGQVRKFRITKLDKEDKTIHLDLA
jgi:small subunit ribosomal protein S1